MEEAALDLLEEEFQPLDELTAEEAIEQARLLFSVSPRPEHHDARLGQIALALKKRSQLSYGNLARELGCSSRQIARYREYYEGLGGKVVKRLRQSRNRSTTNQSLDEAVVARTDRHLEDAVVRLRKKRSDKEFELDIHLVEQLRRGLRYTVDTARPTVDQAAEIVEDLLMWKRRGPIQIENLDRARDHNQQLLTICSELEEERDAAVDGLLEMEGTMQRAITTRRRERTELRQLKDLVHQSMLLAQVDQ